MSIGVKSERLNVRLTPQDDTAIRLAAETQGQSVSDFLTDSAVVRAHEVLADQRHFTLDKQAWEAFEAAVSRPAQARPELVELFKRPRLFERA